MICTVGQNDYLDTSLLTLVNDDCQQYLSCVPSQSVDLVFTSPPYADRRKDKYKSIHPDKYVEWFCAIGKEIKRILKPSGSFMLNLKAACDRGERLMYVYELILALKQKVGLKFIDEYVWYKSAAPRKKTYRLKDCYEPIFHFAIEKNYINHDAIRRRSDSTFANKRGYSDFNDTTGNIGGYHDIANQCKGWTDPDNILYFPTSLLVKDKYPHPAKFPFELAEFMVKGFAPKEGVVCDPFCGSGMTALASLKRGCRCVAVEAEMAFCEMIRDRIENFDPNLQPSPNRVTIDIFDRL